VNNISLSQEDLFELDGVGHTGEQRSVIRQFKANMPRLAKHLAERNAREQTAYDRGYDDGFADGVRADWINV